MATSAIGPSASDMLSMVPSESFAEEVASEPVPETAVEETPEEPIEEVAGAPEAAAEEPESPAPEPPVPGEELPEGVSREAKGLRVEESRWKTIYGNHQLVQQVSELLGEPATREALELRQQAYQMQEQLYSDLNSADPALQGRVLDFVLGDMARAKNEGEVGADPTVPFTQAFYEKIQQHPDAYANLRFSAAKDLIGEMFAQASQSNDPALFSSAQHFARTLAGIRPELLKTPNGLATLRATAERMGLPFYLQEEMAGLAKGKDPVAEYRAKIEQLESQLNDRSSSTQAAQFGSWQNSTNQAIASGILDGAIKPALASIADAWKDFPKEYQEQVITPLQKEVDRVIGQDQAFKGQIKQLVDSAKRAVSPQVRARITQQIQQAYTHRAERAIEANKRPVLQSAAEWLKGRSTANHARRSAGQGQTAPRGVTTAAPRSIIDGIDPSAFTDANGNFDSHKAMSAMNSIMAR